MASQNNNAKQNQLNRSMNCSGVSTQGRPPSAYIQAVPLSTSYLQNPASCPPLPTRRMAAVPFSNRMGMGSYYSPYSRYPTSMYSGYGGYRMSPYGNGPSEASSFVQMAEESTRPAFESIESVVEVVSSISMMLESTYQAVYSSYSAILGVVDQFSRLKDHLAQFLSTLALLRGLRWLCLKVLYLLRLRKQNPSDESAWSTVERGTGFPHSPPLPEKDHGSAWPFLMFLGLVIGAPWLMFKLLSKTVKKHPLDTRVFRNEQGKVLVTFGMYDFKASQRDELSFSAGEKLYISPNSLRTSPKGWAFACKGNKETGLIPLNYCQPNLPGSKQAREGKQGKQTTTQANCLCPLLNCETNTASYSYSSSSGNCNSQPNIHNFPQNPAIPNPVDLSKQTPNYQDPDGRIGNTSSSSNPISSNVQFDHNYAKNQDNKDGIDDKTWDSLKNSFEKTKPQFDKITGDFVINQEKNSTET